MVPCAFDYSALKPKCHNFVIDFRANRHVITFRPPKLSGLRMIFARERPGGPKFDRTGDSKGLALCGSGSVHPRRKTITINTRVL